MTCIVGLVKDGIVYMGADSAAANGWTVRSTQLPKVFVREPFIMGYTSSFRMGQLLQHQLHVPMQPENLDDEAYMVQHFVESVRTCLKDFGYTKIENSREDTGTFLVGYKGCLYHFGDDLQLNRFMDGYDSVGAGYQLALGSLASTEKVKDPCQRIQMALAAAEKFCEGVRSPFTILQLG